MDNLIKTMSDFYSAPPPKVLSSLMIFNVIESNSQVSLAYRASAKALSSLSEITLKTIMF